MAPVLTAALLAGRQIDSWPRQVPFMLKTESTHIYRNLLAHWKTFANYAYLLAMNKQIEVQENR